MAINRYSLNNKLTRLKMELEEAENELAYTTGHRKQNVQNRINNIKYEIEAELARMVSDDYDGS